VVAAIVLTAAVAAILPAYVQSRLIPGLAAEFGLAPGQVQVRRIGLWGADLGPIRLDSRQTGVLILASVQVDYTPWSLLRGRIDGITLGGAGLSLVATPGGISLAGWQPPPREKAPSPTSKGPDLATLLPIKLGHVTVMQSQIEIRAGGRSHTIPLSVRLETADLDRGILRGQAQLSVMGNPLTLRIAVDQRANQAALHIQCSRFLLDALCRSGLLPEGTALSGILDVKGDATLQLDPVAVTGMQISGRLIETRMAAGRIALANTVTSQGASQPIDFTVSSLDSEKIRVSGGPFRIDGPVKVDAADFKGTFIPGRPAWSLDGRLDNLIPQQTTDGGSTWEKELPLNWQIRIGPEDADAVGFSLTSAVRSPWAVQRESLRLSGDTLDIQCRGRFSAGELRAEAAGSTGPLLIDLPEKGTLKIPGVKAAGTLSWAVPSHQAPSRGTVQAQLSNVVAMAVSTTVTLPEIRLQADGRAEPGRDWNFQGRLTLSRGRIQDKARRVDARGLDLDLPLQWPAASKAPAGSLQLDAIQWEGRPTGGLRGTLQQVERAVRVRLEHRSRLFEGLRVLIDGYLDAGGFRADVGVPVFQPAQAVDLGRLMPELAGIRAGGRLKASGTVAVTETGSGGRADLAVEQGFVTRQTQNIRLDGIAMALRIDDIAALKSAPRQKFRVAELQWGDLKAQNLDVDFQIEDGRTLFLEKFGLNWCRGRVNTAAVRVVAGKEDYDVTLFCDRLDLAMVLEQLGVAQAGGVGTVNGRIPLRWVDGRLSFDNGFLYSTPGETGQIQMKDTQVLLTGIPPGTPQYTQLDIATEALKDYTYQWAKVNVQSNKDKLLLKLQLDGKPNRLLPFAYNQESGQFTRVKGEGQAEFKGVGVDLNFNIPLNDVLNYRDLLHK
jgi:hypothetical protein